MNVPSFEFLGFVVAVALLINISDKAQWRRIVLFVANLFFVLSFAHDPVTLGPFAVLIGLGFIGMRAVETYKRKSLFVAWILAIVALFCVFKRYAFMPPALLLPFSYATIGMSYVFFRILHLVIDTYEGALERVSVVSYLNYTLNFLCLSAGPIQMYQDYRQTETMSPLPLTWATITAGFERIVLGAFKVVVIAPVVFYYQHHCTQVAFQDPAPLERMFFSAVSAGLFPLYLYLNFSGYTDFVIGSARLLRLELPENFNQPFAATGFLDFWNRWHMTLSVWVRTYIYSPLLLSLMRRIPSRAAEPWLGVLAYFVTFFLVGLWHGQTFMFVVFGVLLGLGVSVNKLFQITMIARFGRVPYAQLCDQRFYRALSRGVTFAWFAFCSLWFWLTWKQLQSLAHLLDLSGLFGALLLLISLSAVLIALSCAVEEWLSRTQIDGEPAIRSPYVRTVWTAALFLGVISTAVAFNAPAPHIVYRGF